MVELKQWKLIETCTDLQVQGILSAGISPHTFFYLKNVSNLYLNLLSQLPAITHVPVLDTPVRHDVVHYIESVGLTISARHRRMAPDHLKAAKKDFNHIISHEKQCG